MEIVLIDVKTESKKKKKIVFTEEEQQNYDSLADTIKTRIDVFLKYHLIADTPANRIYLTQRQYLTVKLTLAYMYISQDNRRIFIMAGVKKYMKEFSKKIYERYDKDFDKVVAAGYKGIFQRKYMSNDYKLADRTISPLLFYIIRPTLINLEMIVSKKTKYVYHNLSLTRTGKFLGYAFYNEFKKEGINIVGEPRSKTQKIQ